MRIRNIAARALYVPAAGRTVQPGEIIDVGRAPGFDDHPCFEPVRRSRAKEGNRREGN